MQTLPDTIHRGMKVYDIEHHHIGVVDDFKLSDDDPDQDGVETASVSENEIDRLNPVSQLVVDVFNPDDLPDELQDRLLREGYIRIDADGLFAADRYILPEQIASASGDELMLNVKKDELIKRN